MTSANECLDKTYETLNAYAKFTKYYNFNRLNKFNSNVIKY